MAQNLDTYSEKIVQDFYASYFASLQVSIKKVCKTRQTRLFDLYTSLVLPVDVSDSTIPCFQYSPTTEK